MAKSLGILKQDSSPLVDFAVQEIQTALRERGVSARVLDPSRSSELNGDAIVIGVPQEAPWLRDLLQNRGIDVAELAAESFAVRIRDGFIAVVGGDQRGAMYGGLDVAETMALDGLEALVEKSEKPFLRVRSVDHGVPLKSKYPPMALGADYEWARNLHYWKRYFDMMARNRFNAIALIAPFDHMIKNEKYPEATSLTDAELQQNIDLFRAIIKMADDRGIDVLFMKWWDGWNINYSLELAEAHGIFQPPVPLATRLPIWDSALTRDYTKEYVRTLLETYPETKGVVCAPGERIPGFYGREDPTPSTRNRGEYVIADVPYDLQWINETWVAGIQEAAKKTGKLVDFHLRAWWSFPEPHQRIVAAQYPGKMYVPLKFNGEHPYSSPKPHYFHPEWLSQNPRDYEIIWELTVQCDVSSFRWGDPEFVRSCVRNMAGEYAAGGRLPTNERDLRHDGPDQEHAPAYANHVTWSYVFEKHWFANQLWGRLAYNPETPDEIWVKHFKRRFGRGGEHVYRAMVSASKVLPTTTSFHWNYMNGDWQPEFCVGGWNTAEGMGNGIGNFREWMVIDPTKKFHDVVEWIFNHTIDEEWLPIREYVNLVAAGKPVPDGKVTPVAVADMLEGYGTAALTEVDNSASAATTNLSELECVTLDIKAVAYLGLYYAAKTRGATELMFFLRTGDGAHQEKAITHLETAKQWWGKLTDAASPHYPEGVALGQRTRYQNYRGDVDRDIRVARQLGHQICPNW